MGPNFLMNAMSMGPTLPVDLNRPMENLNGPLSETEGFDFKNYVLGLQMEFPGFSAPNAEEVMQNVVSESIDPKTLNASEVLDNSNPLNALFPVLTQQNQVPIQETEKPQVQQALASVDWKALGLSDLSKDLKTKSETEAAHIFQLFANAYQGEDKDLIPKAHLKDIKSVQLELLPEAEMPLAKDLTMPEAVSKPQEQSLKVETQASVEVEEKSSVLKPKTELAKEVHVSEKPEAFTSIGAPVDAKAPTHLNQVTMDVSKPQVEAATPQTWIPQAESLARQGGGKMTVALTPPELGQIEIEVTTRGKNVEIAMRSDNEGAKRVLEGGMSELKTALMGHDLVLAKSEVKVAPSERFMDGMANQSFNFNMAQDRQPSRDNQSFSRPQARWEQTDLISRKPTAVASFTPRSSSRIDVRI